MLKTSVLSPRIDVVGKRQLLDAPQPLHPRMVYYFEHYATRHCYKSVNRIVHNFVGMLWHGRSSQIEVARQIGS